MSVEMQILRLGCALCAPKTGALTYRRILAQDDSSLKLCSIPVSPCWSAV